MSSQLSDLYTSCSDSFKQLLATLETTESDTESHLNYEEVTAEFDRFRLWARSVGAEHSGTNYEYSLDYRLRKAPFYCDRVRIYDRLFGIIANGYRSQAS